MNNTDKAEIENLSKQQHRTMADNDNFLPELTPTVRRLLRANRILHGLLADMLERMGTDTVKDALARTEMTDPSLISRSAISATRLNLEMAWNQYHSMGWTLLQAYVQDAQGAELDVDASYLQRLEALIEERDALLTEVGRPRAERVLLASVNDINAKEAEG